VLYNLKKKFYATQVRLLMHTIIKWWQYVEIDDSSTCPFCTTGMQHGDTM